MPTIFFRGSRAELRRILSLIPGVAAGRISPELTRGLNLRISMTALSLIKEAYVEKARGGTDAAGESWEPLAESTIINRRQGKGAKKQMQIGNRLSGLSEAQKKRYRKEYRDRQADLMLRGLSKQQASSLARAQAFNVVRGAGGRIPTRKEILGGRDVEILRDTNVMYNSLGPGYSESNSRPGEIVIGTNVEYARFQHFGTNNIPQRRLWPEVGNWPNEWWQEILGAARSGLIEIVQQFIERGGR